MPIKCSSLKGLNDLLCLAQVFHTAFNKRRTVLQPKQELSLTTMRSRRLQYAVQCAVSLGEYMEFLPPFMAAGGVSLILRLLDAWKYWPHKLNDALKMLSSLLAHKR